MNNILSVNNIYKLFSAHSLIGKRQTKQVLKSLSFSLDKGEILAILGESGSGKSTLARIISGIDGVDSGEIYFYGKKLELNRVDKRREFYKQVQIVFQDSISAVNPSLSIREVIEEPLIYLSNFDKNKREEIVRSLLVKVGIDEDLINNKATHLSGGQLQRVCIARAMAIQPSLIIFDEATSSIDLILQAQILQILKEMKRDYSFIFITHDIRLARIFCDRIILLDQGSIVEEIRSNERLKTDMGMSLQNAILPPLPIIN